jgi:hypothetical protein
MSSSEPKRQCPFQINYRCTIKCEWFDTKNDHCLMWSFHNKVAEFVTIIQDYISTQMKIRAGRDSE